jgi:uncharacterized protein with HEPN domain
MRDEAYLLDMLIAARRAITFTEKTTAESFRGDDLVQNAVVRVLQVLGEAARQVSARFKAEHPEIPWAQIVGLRHRLVHDYVNIDFAIVWEVVSQDLAPLVRQLEPLVPREDQI